MKENGFKLAKERSSRYPAQTIANADYADVIALLANRPGQAETLPYSLARAAGGICLHVNAQKTEYMCFNRRGNISTLKGGPLKLVDKFTYQGSRVSSTRKNINTQLSKAWTAIEWLSLIWKLDLTDKVKRSFFQAAVLLILLHGCTTWTLTRRMEKRLDGNYTICCEQYWTSPGDNTPQNGICTDTYHPSRKQSKLDEPDMQDTAGEVRTNS